MFRICGKPVVKRGLIAVLDEVSTAVFWVRVHDVVNGSGCGLLRSHNLTLFVMHSMYLFIIYMDCFLLASCVLIHLSPMIKSVSCQREYLILLRWS